MNRELEILSKSLDDLSVVHSRLKRDATNFVWANRHNERAADVQKYVIDRLDSVAKSLQGARNLSGNLTAGWAAHDNIKGRLKIIGESFDEIKKMKKGKYVPTNKDSTTSTMSTGARTAPNVTTRSARTAAAVAAPSAPPVVVAPAAPITETEVKQLADVVQNPNVSAAELRAAANTGLDTLPLTFAIGKHDSSAVYDAYTTQVNPPPRAVFEAYAASVLRDFLRVYPNGNARPRPAQANLLGTVGGDSVTADRVRALFDIRRILMDYYVDLLSGYFAAVRPPPANESDLSREFKSGVILANNVNDDFKLDLDLLEQFRTEVGRLRDRALPGFLRRAFSYATGFLNPFNYKARRVVAFSAIALALGSAGVVAYNPAIFETLGILNPGTTSAIGAYVGKIFSADFFNSLSSSAQNLITSAGGYVVDAGTYVWNFLGGGGAASAAAAAASGGAAAPLLALPSEAANAAAAAANAAASAAPGYVDVALSAGQGLLSGAASAAGSTYEYLANLVSANPAAAAAVVGGGLAGVGAGAAALGRLRSTANAMTAKQVSDAGALIKDAAVADLKKKSDRISLAQDGGKAKVTTENFAIIKELANEVDAANARVTAAAAAIKSEPVNTSLPAGAADPNVAAGVAAVDAMAAVSEVLKTQSTKITQETLNASGAKHMTKHSHHKKHGKKSPTKKHRHSKGRSRSTTKRAKTGSPSRRRSSSTKSRSPTKRARTAPSARKRTGSSTKRAKARASRRR